jgi:hypothetical protein
MNFNKYVQTCGNTWNWIVIPCHYGRTLEVYQELHTEAKKDFCHLEQKDVRCLEVKNSIRFKGCAMLHFQTPKGQPIPNGWFAAENIEEMSDGGLI